MHGRSYFDYKLSVNADKRYNLIRKFETDAARVHDGQHFEAVLSQCNSSADVYGDRGYPSRARQSHLRVNGYRPQIQRWSTSKYRISECQKGAISESPRRGLG